MAAWLLLLPNCRAIILLGFGIDTFSKTNYDQIRRIVQEAGVPIS